MNRLVAVALLVFCAALEAQAPLPAALKDAKSVFLVNDGPAFRYIDRLAKELVEWKRFELVDDPAKADITMRLSKWASMGLQIEITRSVDKTLLWGDRVRGGFGSGAAEDIVKRLRQRLEAQGHK